MFRVREEVRPFTSPRVARATRDSPPNGPSRALGARIKGTNFRKPPTLYWYFSCGTLRVTWNKWIFLNEIFFNGPTEKLKSQNVQITSDMITEYFFFCRWHNVTSARSCQICITTEYTRVRIRNARICLTQFARCVGFTRSSISTPRE